ncbi:hypothetical protein RNZ50_09355 [Paracoccaceae bacterium Fryx2]|nr:hypothetical protein [Paracoccaceae bacterium Fryx2]
MEIMRLRHVATVMNSNVDKVIDPTEIPVRLCNYVHVYKNDFITPEMEFDNGSATEAEIKRFSLRVDDVIITKDSEDRHDIGVPAYVRNTADDLVCGYHLTILRAFKKKCRGGFLFWALQSKGAQEAFAVAASGITRYGLGQEGIKGLSLHLPGLSIQKLIADLLDTETARIDALIAKKQQILLAIADARFSTISRAVSVGLDANAPLVETESPYLPSIPATWRIWRLKHLARVRGGMTLGRTLPEGAVVITTPYLRVANVQAGWVNVSDVAEIDVTETEIKRFSLRRGDVLMNEGGDNDKLGRGAVWHAPFEPCLNQNHVFCVTPGDLRYSDWISMATNARYARDFFYLHSNQSTNLASISKTNVEKLPIAVPPPEEMRAVLDDLNARLDRFTAISERVTNSIVRLREYRAALITAAVTGQIDVAAHAQSAAAKPPTRAVAEVVPVHPTPQPVTGPDRCTVRVLVAADVVHRLGAQPSLGRIKLQKMMYLAEAHANINEIDGRYERYRAGPYDGAMMPEIEVGLRQGQFFDAKEDGTADRGRITFQRMPRAGDHRDALSAHLGDKVASLRSMVDLFRDMNTEATEAVATLYAVWNDALIDGQQPDDAAIIRGFRQNWHADKGKFKEADLHNWLAWMRRNGIVPHGAGPRTISTSTPSLFESE